MCRPATIFHVLFSIIINISLSKSISLSIFSIKDDASLNSIVCSILPNFYGKVASWESQINDPALQFIQFQFCEVLSFFTVARKYFWIFCWGLTLYSHFSLGGKIFRMNFHLRSTPLSPVLNDCSLIPIR